MGSDAVDNRQGVLSAEEALTFLDRASAVLATSLDFERTLSDIAQLMVPTLADWCAIDLAEERTGGLRQITSGHPDPEQEAFLGELRRRYRDERAGSEGVLRVIATGEPELFPDVRGVHNARMVIREEETERYERLGLRSYLIVPLVARGRTIGAMTLLSTREGRHYGESDLAFSLHLARRFALAVDNARLYGDAVQSHSLLDNIFTTAPVGLGFLDADLRFVRVNEALAQINGHPVAAHLGRRLSDLVGEELAAGPERLLREVVDTGRPMLDFEFSGPHPYREGVTGHWTGSYTPIRGADGSVVGVSGTVVDVTDRWEALEAERDDARRARFMAEAGSVLDASLDYEEVLARLARVAVPDFADWCAVSLLDDQEELRQVAVAHVDPDKTRWARELAERYPPVVNPEFGVGKVLATRRPEILNDIDDTLLARVAQDEEHLELLRTLGLCAGVTAPLVARGRVLGVLSVVSAESGRRYDERDAQLLGELGRRAGVAVENARLYTERSRIAHTLQARLLPSRLPTPPGIRLAARYRAAGEFNEVGGDFYDAFQRAPDEWAVLIGDVSGKGPEAAALTALARYTIRAAAANDWSPGHVLRRLNDTLLREEDSQFVTAALAYVRHAGGETVVRLVLGGHPLPAVVRADGRVELVGRPGTLLGIRSDVRLHEQELTLRPGDSLLLYTDGVTEAGPRDAPFGEAGLCALLERTGGVEPEALVAVVDAAAREADPGPARDDIAVLALRAVEAVAGPDALELRRPAVPSELRELRESVVTFGRGRLAGELDDDAVRLAVGEACANAVVHAYRNASEPGEIHLRAAIAEGRLVVEVRDDGCGPAPRSDSPGMGLGLPLMARLSADLQVLGREPSGTLVRMRF